VRRRLLLLSVVSILTFFAGLGRAAISESDEAYYAEAGREMVESGDWLTPRFNYDLRFEKPVLYYWAVAAAYQTVGVSEAAARFGSALSGFGLALLTFAAGRRMFGDRVGFTAGAIVATNFGYFAMAHLSLPDLPLTVFVSLAIWLGLRSLDHPERSAPLVGAAVAAALGLLTKGPLGLLLPLLVLGPVAVIERRWIALKLSRLSLAMIVCVAIAVPWYAAMTWTHGADYLRGFFVGDNVERFATTRFNDPRVPWYYVSVIAGGLLPWTPFALLLMQPGWRWLRRRRTLSSEERRLVIWTVLPFAFFTLSIGKQARYILPVLPPLAILIARAIELRAAPAPDGRRPTLLRSAALASMLILLLVGVTLWRVRDLLAYSTNPNVVVTAASLIGVLAIVASVVVIAGQPRTIVPVVTATTAVTLVALQFGVFSTPRAEAVELAAAFIREHRRANEEIAVYRALARNLVFYVRERLTGVNDLVQARQLLASDKRSICVMFASDVDDLERAGVRLIRLVEFRYFDTATMKVRSVIDPDPSRDLSTVVIVTNK
jgi:4-amino-4-deoxy-L-arabinose transferase-like glycosyltransferase